MVVTAGAFQSEPQKSGAEGFGPIGDIFESELLLNTSSLIGLTMQTVEGRSQPLVGRCVREQIPGQLLGDEDIVGKISVVGPNHPVTPGPDMILLVVLVAEGVGIAGDIQPAGSHVLSVTGRRQQPVHNPLVGPGGRIGQIGVHLFEAGRETGEIQSHPSQERLSVGLVGGRQPFLLQPREHESVDRLANPVFAISDRGRRGIGNRLKRPVGLEIGSRIDPVHHQLDLGSTQNLLG